MREDMSGALRSRTRALCRTSSSASLRRQHGLAMLLLAIFRRESSLTDTYIDNFVVVRPGEARTPLVEPARLLRNVACTPSGGRPVPGRHFAPHDLDAAWHAV